VNLADSYNNFLSQVEKQLKKGFIVNTINEYGLTAAANSNADFLYSEVWPSSYANYEGLQRVVNDSFTASNNKKAVVIAAYVNYGVESGSFNPNAVKTD
jgi:dextranase